MNMFVFLTGEVIDVVHELSALDTSQVRLLNVKSKIS